MKRNGLLKAQRNVFESGLSSTEKLVLLAILDRWSLKSPQPFPTIDQLAPATSLNRRSVIRAVESLRKRGAIHVIRTGRNQMYDLTAAFRGELPAIGATESPVQPANRCHRVTNPKPATLVRSVTLSPAIGDKYDLQLVTQSHLKEAIGKEPSKEPKKRPARKIKRAAPIPGDWEPTAEHRAFATKKALPLDLEVMKFRGHWDGKSLTSVNGAFSKWLANAVTYAERDAARGNGAVRRGPAPAKPHSEFDASGDDFPDEVTA